MIKTVLFDLDGVLVAACEWHYLSLNKALKEISSFEITRADHESVFNGLTTKNKLKLLAELGKISFVDMDKIWNLKQDYTRLVIAENAKEDKTKVELLKCLTSLGINIGCVTNSIKDNARLMLGGTGQLSYINLLISNEMISRPKPHEEGYVMAMSHFNCLPNETLIVEDSFTGIRSARASRANVWEVSGCEEVILENMMRQLKIYA